MNHTQNKDTQWHTYAHTNNNTHNDTDTMTHTYNDTSNETHIQWHRLTHTHNDTTMTHNDTYDDI